MDKNKNSKNKNLEQPKVQSNGYNGKEPTRICPHCNKEKPLSEFGWRIMENKLPRNQSWCKKCRAGTK